MIDITTDTATLAQAMFQGCTIADFNAGVYVYEGTRIHVRQLTGTESVRITGTTSGAKVVSGETWVADRFGDLGARQVKRLIALVGIGVSW